MPVIVRVIPVHREVAGEGVGLMSEWNVDFEREQLVRPLGVVVLDWSQNASTLLQIILRGNWFAAI